MLALLLLVMGTSLGVLVSTRIDDGGATWLTYYVGGIVGLLVSSLMLGIRNIRRKKREMEKEKRIRRIEF